MVRVAAGIVLAALCAAASAAPRDNVERLFKEFGLFGVWARNCAADASPDNPRVTVSVADAGAVSERHDFGPGYEPNRYVIVMARKFMGRIMLDAVFEQAGAEPQRQLIVMSVEAHSRRTMFTSARDEPPRVKDGIATATGAATPVLEKCN